MKIKVELEIPGEEYSPSLLAGLRKYVVSRTLTVEDDTPIDFAKLTARPYAIRAYTILHRLDIVTNEQLKRLTKKEFLKQRFAGKVTWSVICDYLEELEKERNEQLNLPY